MNLRLFLTIVFAGLLLMKIGGLTDLSWLVVLAPLTVPVGLLLFAFCCYGLIGLLGAFHRAYSGKKGRTR